MLYCMLINFFLIFSLGSGGHMNYALTGGSAAREAELQKTLQNLLGRYNGALQPTPGVQHGIDIIFLKKTEYL